MVCIKRTDIVVKEYRSSTATRLGLVQPSIAAKTTPHVHSTLSHPASRASQARVITASLGTHRCSLLVGKSIATDGFKWCERYVESALLSLPAASTRSRADQAAR